MYGISFILSTDSSGLLQTIPAFSPKRTIRFDPIPGNMPKVLEISKSSKEWELH